MLWDVFSTHGSISHDGVIKRKHFPRCWSFVRWIHRSPVNFPRKGQWRGALIFSLICAWINGWVNSHEAGDVKRHRGHYDVTVITANCGGTSMHFFFYKHITTNHTTLVKSVKMIRLNMKDIMEWPIFDQYLTIVILRMMLIGARPSSPYTKSFWVHLFALKTSAE